MQGKNNAVDPRGLTKKKADGVIEEALPASQTPLTAYAITRVKRETDAEGLDLDSEDGNTPAKEEGLTMALVTSSSAPYQSSRQSGSSLMLSSPKTSSDQSRTPYSVAGVTAPVTPGPGGVDLRSEADRSHSLQRRKTAGNSPPMERSQSQSVEEYEVGHACDASQRPRPHYIAGRGHMRSYQQAFGTPDIGRRTSHKVPRPDPSSAAFVSHPIPRMLPSGPVLQLPDPSITYSIGLGPVGADHGIPLVYSRPGPGMFDVFQNLRNRGVALGERGMVRQSGISSGGNIFANLRERGWIANVRRDPDWQLMDGDVNGEEGDEEKDDYDETGEMVEGDDEENEFPDASDGSGLEAQPRSGVEGFAGGTTTSSNALGEEWEGNGKAKM